MIVPGSIPKIILEAFRYNRYILNLWDSLLTLNKNIKLILNYVVGPLVFCILAFSIYQQVMQQADWKQSLNNLIGRFSWQSFQYLLLAFLLMFVNWGLEAKKWQLSLRDVEKVSFARSLQAIFSGTTMAFFTPNRLGEYFGRILFVKSSSRLSSVAFTVMCATAQLLITLWIGFAGLFFIRPYLFKTNAGDSSIFWIELLMSVVLPAALLLTVFYFRLSWSVRWINRLKVIRRLGEYIRVLGNFELSMLIRIVGLSITRYLVFIVQYYLLLAVFEVELNWWQTFWSMSVIFLVLAIVPSIALFTDVGIRWKASLQFLSIFSTNTIGILGASLAVWIINLVIPAVIGSMLIFQIRLFNTGTENYLRDPEPAVKD